MIGKIKVSPDGYCPSTLVIIVAPPLGGTRWKAIYRKSKWKSVDSPLNQGKFAPTQFDVRQIEPPIASRCPSGSSRGSCSPAIPTRRLSSPTTTTWRSTTVCPRDAIIAANADTGTATDTIVLSSGAYTLSISNANNLQENESATGDLDITSTAHALVIKGQGDSGPGATIIDQTVLDRVFQIMPNVSVTFQNLEITGGTAFDDGTESAVQYSTTDWDGGGILASNSTAANVSLTLNDVAMIGNTAGSSQIIVSTGATSEGGGLCMQGYATKTVLIIESCVFENNSAIGAQAYSANSYAGYAYGGAILAGQEEAGTIAGSLISNNTAQGGEGL